MVDSRIVFWFLSISNNGKVNNYINPSLFLFKKYFVRFDVLRNTLYCKNKINIIKGYRIANLRLKCRCI
jgi:hypothetical protein